MSDPGGSENGQGWLESGGAGLPAWRRDQAFLKLRAERGRYPSRAAGLTDEQARAKQLVVSEGRAQARGPPPPPAAFADQSTSRARIVTLPGLVQGMRWMGLPKISVHDSAALTDA